MWYKRAPHSLQLLKESSQVTVLDPNTHLDGRLTNFHVLCIGTRPSRVRALYDFVAQSEAELSFKEGDLIHLLDCDHQVSTKEMSFFVINEVFIYITFILMHHSSPFRNGGKDPLKGRRDSFLRPMLNWWIENLPQINAAAKKQNKTKNCWFTQESSSLLALLLVSLVMRPP